MEIQGTHCRHVQALYLLQFQLVPLALKGGRRWSELSPAPVPSLHTVQAILAGKSSFGEVVRVQRYFAGIRTFRTLRPFSYIWPCSPVCSTAGPHRGLSPIDRAGTVQGKGEGAMEPGALDG